MFFWYNFNWKSRIDKLISLEIFREHAGVKNKLRFEDSVTSEVQFNKGDNFRSDYLMTDKKNITFHYQTSIFNLWYANNLTLCYDIRGEFFIRFILSFFIKLITKYKIAVKVMEQKSKNKKNKTNKIQGRTEDKNDISDFFKNSVSHGSKMQKDLHSKFFFEKSWR